MDARQIFRSIIFLSASEFLSKALNFVTIVVLARIILAGGLGIVAFIFVVASYFSLLVTFGIETIGSRDVARHSEDVSTYVSKVLSFKLIVALILYLIFGLIIGQLGIDSILKKALLIFGLTLISNALTLNWVFIGLQKTLPVGAAQILSSSISLIAVILFISSAGDLLIVIWIFTFAAFVNTFLLLAFYLHNGYKLKFRLEQNFIKKIMITCAPVGMSAILVSVYYNFDHLLLGLLGHQIELGYYSAAYKINLIAVLPAWIISKSFFPQLSQYANDRIELTKLLKNYSKTLFITGTTIVVLISLFAPAVIKIMYGDSFSPSIALLNILSLNILLVFINTAYGNPLLAWDKQKQYFYAIACGATINLIMNFILVPKYLAVGAAVSTIFGEVAVLIIIMHLHWKETKNLYLKDLTKSFFCGVTAFTVCSFCKNLNIDSVLLLIVTITTLTAMFFVTKLIENKKIRVVLT